MVKIALLLGLRALSGATRGVNDARPLNRLGPEFGPVDISFFQC